MENSNKRGRPQKKEIERKQPLTLSVITQYIGVLGKNEARNIACKAIESEALKLLK